MKLFNYKQFENLEYTDTDTESMTIATDNLNELSETIKLMAQTVARQGNILEKLIESQNEMIPKLES